MLRSRVRLFGSLDEVFAFFSDARNLERLTPALLKFQILTPGPIEMGEGTLIDYKLKVHHVPIRWRTRISSWEPPNRFEDIQERGPYKQWIHEHRFLDEGNTTLMQDTVRYRVLGGALIHGLVVKRDVLKIFRYREEVFKEFFPPA